MKKEKAKFKVGDEVFFKRGTNEQDLGIITDVKHGLHEIQYWATWKSDGLSMHSSEKNLTKATKLEKALS